MTNAVSPEMLGAFYEAYFYHDAEKVADYLHDDVCWTLSGPIDILTYCGQYRGKAAVLDMVAHRVPNIFRVFSYSQDSVVIDGDRVATLNRISARRSADGGIISFRLAHFMRLNDGKIIENVSVLDSFDVAEQVLGHRLALHEENTQENSEIAFI